MTRILAFFRRHIELIGVMPVLLALLALAWYLTWARGAPALEVGQVLTDYAVAMVAVLVLAYAAWLAKREYWHDLSPADEADLHYRAASGNRWAFWVLVKDRLEWLALFGLFFFALSTFAGAATPQTRDLLVRWEVSSQSQYVARWQWPIWPGGASGITWGIGYDGGHQHPATIRREWREHSAAERLATTAGITGERARVALPQYRDIVTSWPLAIRVLDAYSIPRYTAVARRAYGRHFEAAPAGVQAALTSEAYNRGESMVGDRRRERRHIRDVCLPAQDAECVAQQLEASCRVWANDTRNGPGLCARRRDEARIARGTR